MEKSEIANLIATLSNLLVHQYFYDDTTGSNGSSKNIYGIDEDGEKFIRNKIMELISTI